MGNRNNIFGGAILVVFGLFFLAIQNDWFNFDVSLREFAKFWPVLIILAGVAVIFNERKTIYNPTTALLVAFAIPLAIYNASTNTIDRVRDEFDEDLNFEWEHDSDNDDDYSSSDTTANLNSSQVFSVDYDRNIKIANLEFGGGAAEFHLSEPSTDKIFEAETKIFGSKYTLEDEKNGTAQDIKFKMNSNNRNNNIKIGKGVNNDVFLRLNKQPQWNLDFGIGAGKLKFDLSEYKIKNIKMETGAADINLKLGDILDESNIKIESGVAKINISVPKGVGCQINMEGALNAKDFDGFTKNKPGVWTTDNFEGSTKKIFIELESGLSAVSIDRY